MAATYLQLKQAAFGFPINQVFTLDDADPRYLDIVNSGLVTVVSNPGTPVPTLAANSPQGTAIAGDAEVAIISGAAPGLAGKWYAPGQGVGVGIPAEGIEHATPVVFARDCRIDRLAVNVTTVGATGSVIRLGVRADDRGMPGALLADAGTVSGLAVATVETATLANPVTVLAGQRLWLTATAQGAAATRAEVSRLTHGLEAIVGGDSAAGALSNSLGGYLATAAQSGALSAAAPAWLQNPNPTRVAARAA